MQHMRQLLWGILKLFIFWIFIFDIQRVIFSLHNLDKVRSMSPGQWLLSFFYSIRLDLATAAYLSIIPLIFFLVYYFRPSKWGKYFFLGSVLIEVLFVALIHAGEVNAYPEWNHKLTSRVFMHLSNPDEVVRTADWGMTFWFALYVLAEVILAWILLKYFYRSEPSKKSSPWFVSLPTGIFLYGFFGSFFFLVARGGWQPIPINIDSAYYTNNHVANDLSVNSLYYFGNSFLLYNRAEIDQYMPKIGKDEAKKLVDSLYQYPRKHDVFVLKEKHPNLVFIILESWAAEAIGSLSETKGATPNFDALAKEGILFTNMYAASSTSEIGNSSIFSGNPAIPEISISLQPEKHRKIPSLNQDLADWGYRSHYIFSGDLKYGNIGGYFMDHGFHDVKDENDFPKNLSRGKLNYYDEDLYTILLERIRKSKDPFLHCAFTGSTHPPYDHPKHGNQNWTGNEADFMNSIIYADSCLGTFMRKCKKEAWYDNTLFVIVADHGHATPSAPVPYANDFFRIPFLLVGNVLKDEFKGKRIDKLGSQSDIAATLLYQMGGNPERYIWSKDLLNPNVPEFALHTIIRGYGWLTPKGSMTYQMEQKQFIHNTFKPEEFDHELKLGHAFLKTIYEYYKAL